MKIALDAMGGDFAPKAAVKGAVESLQYLQDETVLVLVGNKEAIEEEFSRLDFDINSSSKLEIFHAEEVITMGEHPTKAVFKKTKSSITLGFHLLKEREVHAFCSAGNTGAMHVAAMFSIKAIEGVIRPAIASFIPKKESLRYGILVDVGANADVKADVLVQFAEMGSIYAEHSMGRHNPTVGLVNMGEEEGKGDLVSQATYPLLKINDKINFYGNIEGYDMFTEKCDVMVCDGFTGNIVLKMAESFYYILDEAKPGDPFAQLFNYENVGGSPVLGVNGNVVIGHGKSTAPAMKNMILQAESMMVSKVDEKIKSQLQ